MKRTFLPARLITALVASGALLVGLVSTVPASAESQVTATKTVNIRSTPSTGAKIVGSLRRGQTVAAVATARGWTRVRYAGSSAYIASRYLKAGRAVPAAQQISANAVRVTTSALNLRRGPGVSYSVVRVIPKGTRVTLTGKSARGFAEVMAASLRGWVSTRYLARTSRLPAVVGYRTTTANLNVRVSWAAKSTVVAVAKKGTRLSMTGAIANGRSQVLYAGGARWVVTRYLTTRKPVNAPTPTYPVEKGLSANAIAVHRASRAAWPTIVTYYGYRNDPSSDHYRGNALDLMIPNYKTAAGKTLGSKVASWAVANQSRLHIQYVIWNQHIWNVSRAKEGWRPMADRGSDSANHKNHVHISVQ